MPRFGKLSRGSWTALFLCNGLAVPKCCAWHHCLPQAREGPLVCLSLDTRTCGVEVEWQLPDSLRHSAALPSLHAAKPQHHQYPISRVTLACLGCIRLPLDVHDLLPLYRGKHSMNPMLVGKPFKLGSKLALLVLSLVVGSQPGIL